jgi:hypothetical protein
MKPNQIDIELLKSEINKIKNSEDLNTSQSKIMIYSDFASLFENMEKKV